MHFFLSNVSDKIVTLFAAACVQATTRQIHKPDNNLLLKLLCLSTNLGAGALYSSLRCLFQVNKEKAVNRERTHVLHVHHHNKENLAQ